MSNRSGQAYALTVMTPIKDGAEQALRDDLDRLPKGADSPLARLGTTHFGRWLVLHDLVYQGPPQRRDSLSSPYLIFTSNFDGDRDAYLDGLHQYLPEECERIWGHCIGCPGTADRAAFTAYLRHNQIETTFFYSAYPDARVADVLAALERRRQVTALAIATQGGSPADLRAAYRAAFGGDR